MHISSLLKSKRVVNNIVWNSLDAIIYPFLLLVSTPVFVVKLGVELYGIWMFVNTIMASIGILNAGLGDATIKFIAKYHARNESAGVNKIIGATYSIYFVLGILVMAVSFVVAQLIRSFDLFEIAEAYKVVTYYAIIIAGVTLSLKFMEQIFLSVFRGFERYDVASKISIVGKLLIVLVNVLLAYLDFSLTHILLSTAMLSLLFLMVEGVLVNRFTGFHAFYPFFEKQYVREVFSFGIWSWLQSVIGVISGQIDKFIVIGLADIRTFAYYSIALTVFSQIHGAFAASVAWLFPVVSRKLYSNETVGPLYKQSQFYFLSGVTIALIVFTILKEPLILWWLGPVTFASTIDFINLFIGYNLVMAITIIPSYFLNASGHFRLTTIFTFINLISRLVFIPLFFYFFGTTGLVFGLIVSAIAIIPVQLSLFSSRVLGAVDVWSGVRIVAYSFLFFVLYVRADLITASLVLVALITCYSFAFRISIRSIFK